MLRAKYLSTVLLLLAAFAIQSVSALPATQPAAPWSSLPPAQWPQLVLTNDATFEGHSPLQGASAFLMKMPDGLVVVATAKHLIGKAGGVEPPIALPDLDASLTQWKVFPRTQEEKAIEAKDLAERSSGEKFHDWLLLNLAGSPGALPATPLVPRLDPVQVGEKVYLIGVPYSDHTSPQHVYEGTVTARPRSNYFTYEFQPPVQISGFSGAPIIDANGFVVGHGVSRSSPLKQVNGLEVEFGGEDASLAVRLWSHRLDPPATRPAEALHVQLPPDWVAKTPKVASALKFAEYPPLAAYVELTADSRGDVADNTDLQMWSRLRQAREAQNSKLQNRQDSDLTGRQISGRTVYEYQSTGDFGQLKLQYRHIMFECNGCFCELQCWATPANWDDAQPKFDEFLAAVK
jgi:hypothetical protein